MVNMETGKIIDITELYDGEVEYLVDFINWIKNNGIDNYNTRYCAREYIKYMKANNISVKK